MGWTCERYNEHVKAGRAKRVYYTRPWDLSALPDYKPQQVVAGTIREWGSNYFADSNLNDYWETEFHKSQPDVRVRRSHAHGLEGRSGVSPRASRISLPAAYSPSPMRSCMSAPSIMSRCTS